MHCNGGKKKTGRLKRLERRTHRMTLHSVIFPLFFQLYQNNFWSYARFIWFGFSNVHKNHQTYIGFELSFQIECTLMPQVPHTGNTCAKLLCDAMVEDFCSLISCVNTSNAIASCLLSNPIQNYFLCAFWQISNISTEKSLCFIQNCFCFCWTFGSFNLYGKANLTHVRPFIMRILEVAESIIAI